MTALRQLFEHTVQSWVEMASSNRWIAVTKAIVAITCVTLGLFVAYIRFTRGF